MKRFILQLGFFLVAAAFAFGQEDTAAVKENKNAPDIIFEKVVHDYGTIPFDGDGNCFFVFKNTGKDPLIISNAKASCGCTVPKWPKEPIPKGKKDTIHVKYNTKRAGPFTKTITIFSNAKEPQVRLTIKGTVDKAPVTSNESNTSPVKQPAGPVEEKK